MKKMEESAAIYQSYFLTALGYAKYAPKKNIMEKKEKIIQENANGAVLHHYHFLQAYPYPSSGDYENIKNKNKKKKNEFHPVRLTTQERKKSKGKTIREGIKAIRHGRSAIDVVEDLI